MTNINCKLILLLDSVLKSVNQIFTPEILRGLYPYNQFKAVSHLKQNPTRFLPYFPKHLSFAAIRQDLHSRPTFEKFIRLYNAKHRLCTWSLHYCGLLASCSGFCLQFPL